MLTQRFITARRVWLYGMTIITLLLVNFGMASEAQTAPAAALIQPFPGAPLCPTHNDTAWHGLWDDQRGCHYDHTHNDSPANGNAVFGTAGAAWGGQAVSYPWMTANENDMHGHGGYKYYVNTNPAPTCAFEGYDYLNPQNCVTAFRIQYHDAGGNAHMVKRFHSYYLEARLQRGSVVGTIQTGGWADFGCLHESYKENFLPLPGIDPVQANGQTMCGPGGQSIHDDPYRAPMKTLAEIQGMRTEDNPWIWTSHDRYGYNRLGFFFFRTLDSWGSLSAADPYAEHFICPDFRCKYNNSEHNVFNVFVKIPSSLDTDRDGIVNYTGYTDTKGNIVQNCTAPGANCVPLRIVNAPVGNAIWSRNLSGPRPDGDPIRDHDIYFSGQPSGWIQFRSHAQQSPTSTAAPSSTTVPGSTPTTSSTSTPVPSGPFVSTELNPTSLTVGEIALVSVKLNNVPAEGYKSAEFACTYDTGYTTKSVEASNIAVANLFGADAAVAIHDPKNGTFIVAISGTNGNRATTSGVALSFSVKGLLAGQFEIKCAARVSKGDNVAIDLPSTGASLTILSAQASPTSGGLPTATPGDHPNPTATSAPLGSPTPTPSVNGSVTGQVIASKPVTVSLLDASNAAVTSVVANPDGTFSLTAPAGTYTLVATASGFLSHEGSAIITAGNSTARPPIDLLAGDIDGNNVIDQFDALTIGMSYTASTPAAADLNNDATIDFLDLERLAENYRKTGPTLWD